MKASALSSDHPEICRGSISFSIFSLSLFLSFRELGTRPHEINSIRRQRGCLQSRCHQIGRSFLSIPVHFSFFPTGPSLILFPYKKLYMHPTTTHSLTTRTRSNFSSQHFEGWPLSLSLSFPLPHFAFIHSSGLFLTTSESYKFLFLSTSLFHQHHNPPRPSSTFRPNNPLSTVHFSNQTTSNRVYT